MNNKTKIIISFLCGIALAGGITYASLSEQEVIDTTFTPVIQTETSDTATSTAKYSFDIKTIKYFPEQKIELSSTTTEIIPAKYDYATTTHTKTISKDEWNFCRSKFSQKECIQEMEQVIKDSRQYHLEVAEAEMQALQEKLKRTDYWKDFDIKDLSI